MADLLAGIGPICVHSCFICGRHFFHSPLHPTSKGSLLSSLPPLARHFETGRKPESLMRPIRAYFSVLVSAESF
jgi:hypothetical protein